MYLYVIKKGYVTETVLLDWLIEMVSYKGIYETCGVFI